MSDGLGRVYANGGYLKFVSFVRTSGNGLWGWRSRSARIRRDLALTLWAGDPDDRAVDFHHLLGRTSKPREVVRTARARRILQPSTS